MIAAVQTRQRSTLLLLEFRLLESKVGRCVLLAVVAILFLCRFVHLSADYPHFVRWDDGALTDEGWYAAAAINRHAWGLPLLSGDMNTAVLLPVWPLLANAAYALFGYHVEVLRGLAVCTSLVAAGMLCMVLHRYNDGRGAPLFLALLAANPWAFVISRTAFLEGPMLVFFLGALLLVCRPGSGEKRCDEIPWLRLCGAGLLFGMAVLTKSSALPLAPVLGLAVVQSLRPRLTVALQAMSVVGLWAALPMAAFYGIVSRHFSTDALFYLSTIPAHTTFGARALLAQATRPFRYAAGSDHLLFTVAPALLAGSAVIPALRRWWADPLFAFAGTWIAVVLLALIAANNVMVHYLALLIPALLLLAVAVTGLLPLRWRAAFLLLLCCDFAVNTLQIGWFVAHPRYNLRDAARGVDATLDADPTANRVVLGDNAPELALQARIAPVNLFAHSAYLSRQVERFKPDWWLAYTAEDDGSCYRTLLSQAYRAERKGAWSLPSSREVVLYRLYRIPGTMLPTRLSAAEQQACRSPFVARQREFAEVPVDPRFAR